MKAEFKRNGTITLFGNRVGTWVKENVWETKGKHDGSGNSLVQYLWHAYLIDGKHIFLYAANELKEAIAKNHRNLISLSLHTNDEEKEQGIITALTH